MSCNHTYYTVRNDDNDFKFLDRLCSWIILCWRGQKNDDTGLVKWQNFLRHMPQLLFFSFLCHYKFGMKRSFIPTLLISPQAFAVFFYDCKKDIMISKACLWSEYTLVFLWSVLHYPIFYPSSWLDLGIESVPFGYLDNMHHDYRFLDENEFYFGESHKSSVFRRTHPFLGRPRCDLRAKPDKGVFFTQKRTKRIIKILSHLITNE